MAANAVLSSVFLVPALFLLFLYDTALAWLTLGIGLFSLAVAAVVGLLQLEPQRWRYAAVRRLTGEVFQFVSAMSKLHASGAEGSAYASWARGYREQHLAEIRISRLNEHLVAFSAALPAASGAALLAVALWKGPDGLDLGAFLVVYAVSMTFFTAVAELGRSFETIAAIVPGYEQVEPILAAVPDVGNESSERPTLNGGIRLDHVSFRYDRDGPLIVDDLSIHASPGEFIAIVGESGAGKSTLVRLLLGLEAPTSGAIYYDTRDLAQLNRRSVRRQIGVVMQDGALQQGDIIDNIIGLGDDLTIDDAMRAARLAGVDEDINAMPMGMFTPVTDSSGNFSGGQIQRIRIAAALVRDPSIVIFDEATSWLDARAQAGVMRTVEGLFATRIVIAHRMSTIRHADRIYVLEAGRIAQQGRFDELLETEGPFRDLVTRQLA